MSLTANMFIAVGSEYFQTQGIGEGVRTKFKGNLSENFELLGTPGNAIWSVTIIFTPRLPRR